MRNPFRPKHPAPVRMPASTRRRWRRFLSADNAFTCCVHCTQPCRWQGWHPCPCLPCVAEMQAGPPLVECVTGERDRCVTCAQLHGVSISHQGQARP